MAPLFRVCGTLRADAHGRIGRLQCERKPPGRFWSPAIHATVLATPAPGVEQAPLDVGRRAEEEQLHRGWTETEFADAMGYLPGAHPAHG